jgi:hypothetical protein
MADVPSPRKMANVLFLFALVGSAGAGAYLAEKLYYQPMREKEILIGNLKEIVDHMTRDRRVAEVTVTDQTPELTRFKFIEIGEDGEPMGKAKEFAVPGDEVYFDMLVIKFTEPYTPEQENLMLSKEELDKQLLNKAIFFFLRVFSNKVKPEDGFPIDARGKAPKPYTVGRGSTQLEEQLWSEFWSIAADPKKAKERGVRAAHGQAIWTKLEKGKYYVLEMRASGEASIKPVDIPAVLR